MEVTRMYYTYITTFVKLYYFRKRKSGISRC